MTNYKTQPKSDSKLRRASGRKQAREQTKRGNRTSQLLPRQHTSAGDKPLTQSGALQLDASQSWGRLMENVSGQPSMLSQRPLMRLSGPVIQPKLTIGSPDDRSEKEADAVADQVVSQIRGEETAPLGTASPTQRSISHRPVQSSTVQRDSSSPGGAASASFQAGLHQTRGRGQALDSRLRGKMEKAMGADFRGVRIHTGAQASKLSDSIQAEAFTVGQDVFFNRGTYNPNSRSGQSLIAHELTHVVQQRMTGGKNTIQRKIKPRVSPDLSEKAKLAGEDELKKAYNNAWEYLWQSPKARHIYTTIDNLKDPNPFYINVGYDGGSVAHEDSVDWGIDFHIQIDKPNSNFIDQKATKVNITGITSSAVVLLHEMGHVKQRHDTYEAESQAGQVYSKYVLGGKKPDWARSVDTLVRGINTYLGNLSLSNNEKQQLATPLNPIERDNVTRHERVTAKEIDDDEPNRIDYDCTTTHDHVTDDIHDTSGQIVKNLSTMDFSEMVTKSHSFIDDDEFEKNDNFNDWNVISWLEKVCEVIENKLADNKLAKWKRTRMEKTYAARDVLKALITVTDTFKKLEMPDDFNSDVDVDVDDDLSEEKVPDSPKWE